MSRASERTFSRDARSKAIAANPRSYLQHFNATCRLHWLRMNQNIYHSGDWRVKLYLFVETHGTPASLAFNLFIVFVIIAMAGMMVALTHLPSDEQRGVRVAMAICNGIFTIETAARTVVWFAPVGSILPSRMLRAQRFFHLLDVLAVAAFWAAFALRASGQESNVWLELLGALRIVHVLRAFAHREEGHDMMQAIGASGPALLVSFGFLAAFGFFFGAVILHRAECDPAQPGQANPIGRHDVEHLVHAGDILDCRLRRPISGDLSWAHHHYCRHLLCRDVHGPAHHHRQYQLLSCLAGAPEDEGRDSHSDVHAKKIYAGGDGDRAVPRAEHLW
jgi:hypothetical protein